jgi:hypothetical protein
VGEFQLDWNEPAEETLVNCKTMFNNVKRRGISAFYSELYIGDVNKVFACRPRPDLKSHDNKIAAVVHRLGRSMPPQDRAGMEDWMSFGKAFVRKWVPRASKGTDVSVSHWLEGRNYPGPRKDRLRCLFNEIRGVLAEEMKAKCFIKAEAYDKYKCPRGIYSYEDRYKAQVGPYAEVYDDKLFSLPWFVKHMDVRDRPTMMRECFGGDPVLLFDYTSMESHHREHWTQLFLFSFEWVMGDTEDFELVMELISTMIGDYNHLEFDTVVAYVLMTLLSGDLFTSSRNGLCNLVNMLYMHLKTKYPHLRGDELVNFTDDLVNFCRAEGDDGIQKKAPICPILQESLGIVLKAEEHANFGTASFCGIVSDPASLENMTDPRKALVDFGVHEVKWLGAAPRTLRGLYKSKAQSYGYAYPNCPIIGAYVNYVLRCTSGYNVMWTLNHVDSYKRSELEKRLKENIQQVPAAPSESTRALFSALYGISPDQQICIEGELNRLTELGPYNSPYLNLPQVWLDHAASYVTDTDQEISFDKPFMPRWLTNMYQSRQTQLGSDQARFRVSEWKKFRRAHGKLNLGR